MDTNSIITDISFLYELSLSVGQSLDKKENCKKFLHTLMSRKNLEFGAVWINSYSIPYSENTSGYRAIFSHPHIKLKTETIPKSEFLNNCFNDTDSFSIKITDEVSRAIGFKMKESGTITFFRLQDLGFMVIYSSSNNIWSNKEQTKLKNVINKFTISIKACLFHEKSIQDLITISKTQKALEQSKIKAEEANELKSAFLSNISHEFRTPINSIVGFSNLLSDRNLSQEQEDKFIVHISDNSHKLLRMINNLLDVSKIDSNQLSLIEEDFNLNRIINDIHTRYLSKIHDKPINLNLIFPLNSENNILKADKNKFIQIFENLLDNAIKFTHQGSIEIGYYLEKNNIPIFYIRDTGVGISQDKQGNIFDLFRQVDGKSTRKFEGSGIGLTLCQKLLHLMNGEIWFDSEENIGSNFYFRLSGKGQVKMELINDNLSEDNVNPLQQITTIEYSRKTVLIAEDVKSNFNYLNSIIELTDAKVIWAKNGKDAIQICKKEDCNIDLVLMDIKMPEINGLDAIKTIKKFNKNLPIIVQTAFAMNNEREDCINAGADDFITKPIDPRTIIKVLKKYL